MKKAHDISILIVEDEPLVLKTICDIIQRRYQNVYAADNGLTGIERYMQHKPDIVITDIRMPKKNGLEMALELKTINPDVKIIVLTAFNDTSYLVNAIDVGVHQYIFKPVQGEKLIRAIKRCEDDVRMKRNLEEKTKELESANQELLRAKEKAEQSDKLKSAFLSNMSHEIRTPINSIIGFANLLNNSALEVEKRREYINVLNINSHHLLHLINDILDLSRIESDNLTIKKRNCNLNKLIDDLASQFQGSQTVWLKHNNTIKTKKGLSDGKDNLYCDPVRLKQVLSNLVSNAIKFTDNGTILFGYELINNEILRFIVKDDGIGIPPEMQISIFDRFRQIDDSLVRKYHGSGLGLPISKGLIELMGGELTLQSESGKGTLFSFELAYEKADKKITEVKCEENFILSVFPNYTGKKLLIAEDNEANFLFLQELFDQTYASIIRASNGKEAIDLVRKHKDFDLVLMDIRLPIIDGFEATREIKKIKNDLPVIAQTAYAIKEDLANNDLTLFDAFVTKPIQGRALFEIISNIIR